MDVGVQQSARIVLSKKNPGDKTEKKRKGQIG